jgi:hypothetical protein
LSEEAAASGERREKPNRREALLADRRRWPRRCIVLEGAWHGRELK